MDFLQLVFGFVNAPLFATFLLGMFWKRTTGHGAFFGLLSGTVAAALTYGLTVAEDKGGWIAKVHSFPSTMAQNFWIAIFAWTTCFLVTIAVSLATKPRPESELQGWSTASPNIPHEAAFPGTSASAACLHRCRRAHTVKRDVPVTAAEGAVGSSV